MKRQPAKSRLDLAINIANQWGKAFKEFVIDDRRQWEIHWFDERPQWVSTADALRITTTSVKSDSPVVFKIELD